MVDAETVAPALTQLQSSNQAKLLDLIDDLRSTGLSQYNVGLPQLVVCGDQSSGKSSVLEAISRVRFPSKDNLCTRFASELILRRAAHSSVTASIRPGPKRTNEERKRLLTFRPEAALNNPDDFSKIIEEAGSFLGLTEHTTNFSEDVLSVEITGPEQPHLTLVDLPGLIHTEAGPRSGASVQTVRDIVERYITNPRSIILAVVSGSAEIVNQEVLERARVADPDRRRTFGIITKPDALDATSGREKEYINLANNSVEAHQLALGWHVLKNRSFVTRESTSDERDRAEADFFEQGVWAGLDRSKVGVNTLRQRLSKVLMQQIALELPSLIKEIESGVRDARKGLERLGSPRSTPLAQKLHLSKIATKLRPLIRSAVNGSYDDDYFSNSNVEKSHSKYLQAVIQGLNRDFAAQMLRKGHQCDTRLDGESPQASKSGRESLVIKAGEILQQRRGHELPPLFNPAVIGEVFRFQSQPWEEIARNHVLGTWDAVQKFLHATLASITSGATLEALIDRIISPFLDDKRAALDDKLSELLRPFKRGSPMTYNRAFSTAMSTVQGDRMGSHIRKQLQTFHQIDPRPNHSLDDIVSGLETLERGLGSNMLVEMSAFMVVDIMLAYYEIALDQFVDNVASLAIQNILLDDLEEIFSSDCVHAMDEDRLYMLAAEAPEVQVEREFLQNKLRRLETSRDLCKSYQASRHSSSPYSPGLRTSLSSPGHIQAYPTTPQRGSKNGIAISVTGSPSEQSTTAQPSTHLSTPYSSSGRSATTDITSPFPFNDDMIEHLKNGSPHGPVWEHSGSGSSRSPSGGPSSDARSLFGSKPINPSNGFKSWFGDSNSGWGGSPLSKEKASMS